MLLIIEGWGISYDIFSETSKNLTPTLLIISGWGISYDIFSETSYLTPKLSTSIWAYVNPLSSLDLAFILH